MIAFLIVGILPFTLVSVVSFVRSNQTIKTQSFDKLTAIRDIKKRQIQDYFESARVLMYILARSGDVVSLYDQLVAYHDLHGFDPNGTYDIDTPEYEDIIDGLNAQNITQFNDDTGFADIYLICAKHSHVMYSASGEKDLGSNLRSGPYKGSGLHKIFEKALLQKRTVFQDFELYEAINNKPAAFEAKPIYKDDKLVSVLVIRLSLDSIDNIMQARNGMGETAETYLVGSDQLMRSDSFFDKTYHSVQASFTNPEKGKVDTVASREALNGKEGVNLIKNFNGQSVLSSYSPIKVGGGNWAIIAEMAEDEAFADMKSLEWLMGILAIVGISAIVFIAIMTTRSITQPINATITGISKGARKVSLASKQLNKASQDMAAGVSEQASSLAQVSASLEEMSSMTKQNSDNAVEANTMSKTTKLATENGQQSMLAMVTAIEKIKSSSDESAKVVKIIDEIAFQTNLLALNAAVEAARAGDAGKGFAVVADEVRSLAQRSASAAKDTSLLIAEVQHNADEGVAASSEVEALLRSILEGVQKVAALVSEVSAASCEQSQGIDQINKSVGQMDDIIHRHSHNAEQSSLAGQQLSEQAVYLNHIVDELVILVKGKLDKVMIEKESTLKSSIKRSRSVTQKASDSARILRPDDILPMSDDDLEDF